MAVSPLRVGVVFGGDSGEHAVSIRSARTVIGGLRSGANSERYAVSCFYIDRAGRWWPPTVAETVLADGEEAVAAPADAPAGLHDLPDGADAVQVWFPVLHGPNGEDGTIQGLFTLMRRPYVGSGVLGSALGMDKQAMKAAFAAAGLPQVPYICVQAEDLVGASESLEALLDRVEAELGYPCFVKPANLGSSVGITKARDRTSLLAGLRTAAALDPRLVVERGVTARELECAVLGGGSAGPLRASVLGEIRFSADWYDYETKYSEGLSHTEIPAQVPDDISDRARQLALVATRAVAASGLARVDFFWDEANGQLWLNEINTMPGFTSQSMYPMLWAASGLQLEDLVHELVRGARQ